MSAPDFDKIADGLVEAFKRAAFDRMMHIDGCPEGEQIRAGIAAIAPAIYRAGLEDMRERAATEATDFAKAVKTFGSIKADPFAAMEDGARTIAIAIRAIKVEG